MSDSELGLVVKATGRFLLEALGRPCRDAELVCVVSGSGKVGSLGLGESLDVNNQIT